MLDSKNYQIVNLVATGGTAVLYRAIQTSLDRTVAIKKLHPHLTEDENFTRRFVLEAKAAASLDHENIVKIIDFGNEDNAYMMVMEFIEGESLRTTLDRWKQLPVEQALAIVCDVCMGLEHAHQKGIVHRDIKPGNVMLTRTGRIKITDFGLAKLTQATTQHTAANSILGTPLYMSPEQAFGESVDHRSDLFSLGTMLYEMLTGVQPFHDENYMGVIQNIINRNAPHPSKFNAEIPNEVQSILSKAMNKHREARFQSASDFKRAIEKYLGIERLKAASDSLKSLLQTDGETVQLTGVTGGSARKRRVRRPYWVGFVLALLVGGARLGYGLAPDEVNGHIQNLARMVGYADPQGIPTEPADHTVAAAAETTNAMSHNTSSQTDSVVAASPTTSPTEPALAEAATREAQEDKTPDDSAPSRGNNTVMTASVTETALVETATKTPPPAQPRTAPAPRTGWLSVSAQPSVEIYVDGMYRGDSPPARRIELTRGPHTLECRRAGHESYHETVTITRGELSTRSVVLKKLMGRVTLTTIAEAEVYVDGVFIGQTPLEKAIELAVGEHQLTIKKAGYNTWNNKITLAADDVIPLRIILSPIY